MNEHQFKSNSESVIIIMPAIMIMYDVNKLHV